MDIKITFANGSGLDAEVNGNCYITDEKPEFPDDISVVTVTADDPYYNRIYHNAQIIECASTDGRYWFTFRELSPVEVRLKELEDTNQILTDCLLEMSEMIYS